MCLSMPKGVLSAVDEVEEDSEVMIPPHHQCSILFPLELYTKLKQSAVV